MINGIPIKLASPDENGAFTNIETPVFATVRKCPKLLGLLKAVDQADLAETAAGRRVQLATEAMVDADESTLEAITERASAAASAALEASLALCTAIRDFVHAGFVGAGYTPADADRYADLIGADRLAELRAATLLGAGRLDFS